MTWKLWVLFGVMAFMAIILIDAQFFSKKRKKRPMSERFGVKEPKDTKTPLGMEAIDMDKVREAEHGNRTIDDRQKTPMQSPKTK